MTKKPLKDEAVILQRLKQATRERHAALEARLPLLQPDLSLAVYRQFMARFLGYYAPLEASLLPLPWWQQLGFTYSDRRKAPRLEQDLLALGACPNSVQCVPRCQDLPPLDSLPQLLGCLYVVEGATLGGQIITRHLHTTLGLTPGTGVSFFSGYGATTGSRWKAFCTQLTTLAAAGDAEGALIASANATFSSLDRWLFPRACTKTEPA
jgi:heme oxygenase (biliverdin-IX-beta and delta-forming)